MPARCATARERRRRRRTSTRGMAVEWTRGNGARLNAVKPMIPPSRTRPERRFTVYILRCRDGSLYTGITTALSERVAAHQAGRAARYTRSRRPVELVWHVARQTGGDARRLEWALKQEPRSEKQRLVAGARDVYRRVRRKALTANPKRRVVDTKKRHPER